MSKQTSRGLGKGFGSLLPQDFDQSILLDKHDRVQKLLIQDIEPDPNQPRRHFDEESLNELAQSIKRHGILQPLVVTKREDKHYIVAGERRFRAAKKAGLDRVPVLVRSLQELERLEISLVENVQRVDLNPIEQAVSIAKLHEQFNIPYQEIADRLGKGHSTIVNIVRLLRLPDFAREALSHGRISEGHARAVLPLKSEELQKELIKNIEQNGWSVRRAEEFVAENRTRKRSSRSVGVEYRSRKPIKVNEKLSQKLSTKWGSEVKVVSRMRGGGRVALNFKTDKQLKDFIRFLEDKS